MFSVCPKINKICPFCTDDKGILRCGLIGGSLNASEVKRLEDCPKNMSKYQITKYVKSVL